ncbi:hypothetical protein CKJ63_07480 [Mycobacterium avium]|nr:hypothetical protein CKJ63_07480 [Mycobacterium avium]
MIVVAATALVVIDLIIKLAPLIIVTLGVVLALRIVHRHRHPAAPVPPPPAALSNVPDTAAFVYAAQTAHAAGRAHHAGVVNRPPRYAGPQHPDRGVLDAEVIDAEVISEDDHRG